MSIWGAWVYHRTSSMLTAPSPFVCPSRQVATEIVVLLLSEAQWGCGNIWIWKSKKLKWTVQIKTSRRSAPIFKLLTFHVSVYIRNIHHGSNRITNINQWWPARFAWRRMNILTDPHILMRFLIKKRWVFAQKLMFFHGFFGTGTPIGILGIRRILIFHRRCSLKPSQGLGRSRSTHTDGALPPNSAHFGASQMNFLWTWDQVGVWWCLKPMAPRKRKTNRRLKSYYIIGGASCFFYLLYNSFEQLHFFQILHQSRQSMFFFWTIHFNRFQNFL